MLRYYRLVDRLLDGGVGNAFLERRSVRDISLLSADLVLTYSNLICGDMQGEGTVDTRVTQSQLPDEKTIDLGFGKEARCWDWLPQL